jgi:vacuolar-type H+-ATPase subunit H
MSIEKIRDLVKQERMLEEKYRDAERKAAEIIREAKEKATRMLEEASDESYYEDILKQKSKEMEEKKRLIDKDTDEKIKLVAQIAAKNREKTIDFIIEHVLGK